MNKPDSELSAEQRVKQVYPQAEAMKSQAWHGLWMISTPADGNKAGGRLSDYRPTEAAAWESAARHPHVKLPSAATPEPAIERCSDCPRLWDGEGMLCEDCPPLATPEPPSEASVEGGLLPLAVGTDAEWDESVKTGRQVKLIVRERQLLEALQKIKELNSEYERGIADGRRQGLEEAARVLDEAGEIGWAQGIRDVANGGNS